MFDLSAERSYSMELTVDRRKIEFVLRNRDSSRHHLVFNVANPGVQHLARIESCGSRLCLRRHARAKRNKQDCFHWATTLSYLPIHFPKSASMNCLTPERPDKRIQKAPFSRSCRRSMSKNGQQRCSPPAHSATKRKVAGSPGNSNSKPSRSSRTFLTI